MMIPCEQCDTEISAEEAYTEKYPGVEGAIKLAFCPDCTEDRV